MSIHRQQSDQVGFDLLDLPINVGAPEQQLAINVLTYYYIF